MTKTYEITTPTETGDHVLTITLDDLDAEHDGRSYHINHYDKDDETGDSHTYVRISGNMGPEEFLDHLRSLEHIVGHEILGSCRIVEFVQKIGVEALVESMIDELLKPMDDHQKE